MPPISQNEISLDQRLPAEHESRADDVLDKGIGEQSILVRVHIVDPKAGVRDPVSSDEIVIGISEIHSVTFITDLIADNPVVQRFPDVNAVAARGGREIAAAGDVVLFDGATIDAAEIDAEGVVFNAATGDGYV